MSEPEIHGVEEITPGEDVARRQADRTRRRRVRALVAGLLALALVIAGGVFWLVRHLQEQARICSGLEDVSGPGYALSKRDDECIGWVTERDHAFSADIKEMTARITEMNRQVAKRWSSPEQGRDPVPYVRVGVLMPMTSDAGSAMSTDTIKHSLEGIYTAQARANHPDRQDFRSPNSVGVQVVLVNEGRLATHWRTVVGQLVDMSRAEHPLVAVVGLGISIPEAKSAAEELGRHGVVSIGGVITATDMVADHFFKVSPSNVDYVRALGQHLSTRPDLRSGFLVFDSNDDNFTRTLQQAFDAELGSKFRLDKYRRSFTGTKKPHPPATPAMFGHTVNNICVSGADVVFYAGRERDLPALIGALAERTCNPYKPIAIAIGATGLGRTQGDPAVLASLQKSQLSVINASSTYSTEWSNGRQAPTGYRAFRDYFTGELKLPEEALLDGYAIMHHDALATAIWAVRLAAEEKPPGSGVPAIGDVIQGMNNMHGTEAISAASGTLSFNDISDGWPHCKVVPIVHIPYRPAAGPLYQTSCEQ